MDDLKLQAVAELEKLTDEISFYEYISRIEYLRDVYRDGVLEKEGANVVNLVKMAALSVKMLEGMTNTVESWLDELISQMPEVPTFPNVFVFDGLLGSLISELHTEFNIHEEISINALVKIGSICLVKGAQDVGFKQEA